MASHFIDYGWHQVVPIKASGTPSLAFLLGLTGWWLANKFFDPEAENERAAKEKGDPLELLLRKALRDTKPILLTVKNGKVYLGFITSNSSPAVPVESVKILPLASGHRRDTDKRLNFTTNYSPVYQKILDKHPSVAHVTSQDFEIVIPYREIESANLFDAKIYQIFFASGQPGAPSDDIETPKLLSQ